MIARGIERRFIRLSKIIMFFTIAKKKNQSHNKIHGRTKEEFIIQVGAAENIYL